MIRIPFNKPFLTGKETTYIESAVASGKISGNGEYTKRCQSFFETRYNIKKALLTTSCTDALEMAAILTEIGPGDEVIIPSYTFVSSANPFVLRGAKVVFVDSCEDQPNVSIAEVARQIGPRTKAIVVVHYAGVAVDMDALKEVVADRDIAVIEDAAQGVDSFYKGRPLGSIGDIGAFSFHETKNIISGEGGLLSINNEKYIERSEIIWEKGTNRAAFWRGEVDKYGWVDIGSSFLPSEVTAAFLYAQLENLDYIQEKRKLIWQRYHEGLQELSKKESIGLPVIPDYASNNAHMYYIICSDLEERSGLIAHLKEKGIYSVFHYLSLHRSPFYETRHEGQDLPQADRYTACLLRLPFYFELTEAEQKEVIYEIHSFYRQ